MTFQGRKALGKVPSPARAKGAPRRHTLPPQDAAPADNPPALSGDVLPSASPLGADIPPHVWNLLQQAGELAAQRLVQIIQSPRFTSYAPSAQRGLIELALTRAYGLPVRKALNLNLSSSDADAVAASLADLAGNLPETARQAVREALDPSPGMDTSQNG
jgi:hypothetical protein